MKERIPLLLAAAFISATTVTYLRNTHPVNNAALRSNHMRGMEKESDLSAQDALAFTTMAANYPNKTLPHDAYAKAMDWYRSDRQIHKNISVSTSWISLGPNNIGGRTIGFAIDPTDTSVIWCGSASGGLWKSTTGGIGASAWTLHTFGVQALGVSSIAINPQNHLEMYAGTGEVYSDSSYSQGIINIRATRGSYGMGLFKSIDGGNTWTQSINWTYQQNLGIWDVVYNPRKPSIVYVAATNGVWKTYNSGASWTQVLNIPMVMSLVLDNADTSVLVCGVGNYGSTLHGVYRSSNSGATWGAITSGLPAPTYEGRVTIASYVNGSDTMFAHICDVYNSIGIYLSTNAGLTWVQQSSSDEASYQGWYSKGLLPQPGNPSNLLTCGVDLYFSTDMGVSFNQLDNINFNNNNYMHTDVHGLIANPKDPNMIYILTDGGLFRSNDFGNTYYECTGGYITSQSYIGSISSTDTTIIMSGLQDNYTDGYTGNSTWQAIVGGDGCYNAIDHTNENVQYGAYQYLNVYKTTNNWGGANQILSNTSVANDNYNYAAFLAPYILCYSNTNYIYAGGEGLQLSTNGGNSFNFKGNNPVNPGTWVMCIAASRTNPDSIYFCTAPDSTVPFKMFFSANEGTNVTDITSGLPDRYPRRIAVNPSNSAEVYIVFSGFGTGHVFKSTNGGRAWTDISTNLPDMPFETVTVDPMYPTHIFVGCDYGAFYSTDDGNTWVSYDVGFPDATEVYDLIVSPLDHYLYAFTFGRGQWKRSLADVVTGTNDVKVSVTDGKVYPNPATTELHINLSNYNSGNNFELSVYTMQGKEVYNTNFQAYSYTIPVSNLASGMYIVTVRNNGEIAFTDKFVKQ
jgi:photosystem II stability/assembly factor-like uncharacterized protein